MAPLRNGRLLFNEIPPGVPEPGKTTVYDASQTIDLEAADLHGGVLVKTLFLSLDPYLRRRMRDPEIKTYSNAFIPGEPLNNHGVGLVLRSADAAYKPGDHVHGIMFFQEYFVRSSDELKIPPLKLRVLPKEGHLPWSAYLGVCGMPGETAYMGWKEYAHPKKGGVAFITAGAGAVGSLVIQLAKADGLKVIASAGSDAKVAYLRELGADVAFNYKSADTTEMLAKEGPIDIFWDNVGGETLEAALDGAARGARFIECGMISGYNLAPPPYVKNLMCIVRKELAVSGFIVSTLYPKYVEEFSREIPLRVARGEIRYREDVTHGLERGCEALVDVLVGANQGKKILRVAEE